MAILEAHNLTKRYRVGDRTIPILESISLTIEAGEFVVIVGTSGSGKTTLLSLLSSLDKPSSGRVVIDGRDITDLAEDDLALLRNNEIGFVFQAFHLVPSLNAIENVMFPAELKKDRQARDKAERLLKQVGLWERQQHLPEQLSGGEKQRIAICRALINDPKIVFADEPTGNLDSKNSTAIIALMTELHRAQGTTLVLATHSAAIADQAQKIIRLEDGRLTGKSEI